MLLFVDVRRVIGILLMMYYVAFPQKVRQCKVTLDTVQSVGHQLWDG